MRFLLKFAFNKEYIQILKLRESLHIYGKIDLIHLSADKENLRGVIHGKVREQVKDDCCLTDSWISNYHIVHSFGKSLVTAEQFIHYLPCHPVLEKSLFELNILHSYDIPYHDSSVFTNGTNASLYSSG